MSPSSQLSHALTRGCRWLVWVTQDEPRARHQLQELATTQSLELEHWSLAQDPQAYAVFAQRLAAVLDKGCPRTLWVWQDFDPPPAQAPRLVRLLRELAQSSHPLQCVFVQYRAPQRPHPPERLILECPPPSPAQLADHLAQLCLRAHPQLPPDLLDRVHEHRHALARRMVGLERWQLEAALHYAGDPDLQDWPTQQAAIERYKAKALGASRFVEPCRALPLGALGGLSHYKTWLAQRKLAMSDKARALGVEAPRGVLLAGVPGCGKSLAAKVTAKALDLPLYRLDLGRIFAGLLGQSEANLRQTLRLCERLAPAVLWIDELDKGIAPQGSSGDGGTARRSLATLLSWMQEHQSGVFVVATANQVQTLPPEITRRGRLDEVFFVDLPDLDARMEIFDLLGCPSWPAHAEAKAEVASASHNFSGAELKAAVTQAKLSALAQDRAPGWPDLRDALRHTVPLASARPEEIEGLRAWGATRARAAHPRPASP